MQGDAKVSNHHGVVKISGRYETSCSSASGVDTRSHVKHNGGRKWMKICVVFKIMIL